MILLTKKLVRTNAAIDNVIMAKANTIGLLPVTGKRAAELAPRTAGAVAPNTAGAVAPRTAGAVAPSTCPAELALREPEEE
jgi:hypothetical protein